ncbi:MAG: Ycf66 family protein [Cyanobium sp.]
MLATLGGTLALALGVAVLLLPLVVNELSRPRDAVWGGVVLLLGLVLVTSAERLTGAPMLAVLCGGLLIGRLGSEVGLGRWRQLSEEERQRLGSPQRWRTGLSQLGASLAVLLQRAAALPGVLGALVAQRQAPRSKGRRWVRPEPASEPLSDKEAPPAEVVSGFAEIDALINAAGQPPQEPPLEAEPEGPPEAG